LATLLTNRKAFFARRGDANLHASFILSMRLAFGDALNL
jgi:hypothetical protein